MLVAFSILRGIFIGVLIISLIVLLILAFNFFLSFILLILNFNDASEYIVEKNRNLIKRIKTFLRIKDELK